MLYPLSYGSGEASHLRVCLAQQASGTSSQLRTSGDTLTGR